MSLIVVGSVALDSIATPHGQKDNILGGAATYFSVGARRFAPVEMVGVVGEDFPAEHVALFEKCGIGLEGLDHRKGGKTFRWKGSYEGRMDVANTLDTQLNVLGAFKPDLSAAHRGARYCFLANTDPVTQAHVRDQLEAPRFSMLDTMNFWIDGAREALLEAMRKVDGVVMNDEEARALGGSDNLIAAMSKIAGLGVRTLVVKKGEHGSILQHDGELFALPAYPLETVLDPTGAGDTFAAGFMGYLAEQDDPSFPTMKKALAYGTVLASFTVEGFGLSRLIEVERSDIDKRVDAFLGFVSF